jgi:hypothetical protein
VLVKVPYLAEQVGNAQAVIIAETVQAEIENQLPEYKNKKEQVDAGQQAVETRVTVGIREVQSEGANDVNKND